jgi:hypothetical protein
MSWAIVAGAAISTIGGGLLGSQGTTTSQSTQKTMPDYLKPYLTGADGTGGLLGDVSKLYQQQSAAGGLNPLQKAGIEAQRQFLTSPQYTAGYDQMRQQGMDLLGRPIAGNPFTSGNTGGMGGYGSLSAQGAGGQASHPSANNSSFQYSQNPTLMAALAAPANAPAPTPAPQTQIAPSIDDIIAELQRRVTQSGSGSPDLQGAGA